jgi:CBS-domain-containing membrane protein
VTSSSDGPVAGAKASPAAAPARRSRPRDAFFAFAYCAVSIGLVALAATVTGQPLVYPSLGPTAFVVFHSPQSPLAAPRTVLAAHAIGAGAGWLALVVTGLTSAPPATTEGVTIARAGAAALALGLTAGLTVLLRVVHAPAAATTLIVSLGLLTRPRDLGVLMLGVLLIVLQAYVVNHVSGIDYPLWAPHHPVPMRPVGSRRYQPRRRHRAHRHPPHRAAATRAADRAAAEDGPPPDGAPRPSGRQR